MDTLINKLVEEIKQLAANPTFIHHQWFSRWHLQIVADLTEDMLKLYPDANRDVALVMAWMHDYGKIVDFDNQYDHKYVDQGARFLVSLGFEPDFAETIANNIKTFDAKTDLESANIETRIVSSADGCSHVVGPFMDLYWWENPTIPYTEIMQENARYLKGGWEKKIVIPEAKKVYRQLYDAAVARAEGTIPHIV